MEPILILGQPRSGSSMTAGIFAQHGVWTGECREGTQDNPKGFYENIGIRKIIIDMHKAIVHDGVVAMKIRGFRDKVEQQLVREGYKDGPWLWKGSALYHQAWFEFQPKFVVCYRPEKEIFDSCRRAPHIFGADLSDEELIRNIRFHHRQMKFLVACKGAAVVETANVAAGNFESIQKSLAACGVEYDHGIVSEFVDQSLWHSTTSP